MTARKAAAMIQNPAPCRRRNGRREDVPGAELRVSCDAVVVMGAIVPQIGHRVQRISSIFAIGLYDCSMDTRQLEYFVAVADERNFTRAADRVHAAQSTVSAGIRSLERELGVDLFDRDPHGVQLTPLGA